MNNAKLWLVVKPGVGIPMLLAAVAIASLVVHVGLVVNTDWIANYHQGVPMAGE
jgi:light-harvesting protein B-800-850 alpha chain